MLRKVKFIFLKKNQTQVRYCFAFKSILTVKKNYKKTVITLINSKISNGN
jgi:hypothetical protein